MKLSSLFDSIATRFGLQSSLNQDFMENISSGNIANCTTFSFKISVVAILRTVPPLASKYQ